MRLKLKNPIVFFDLETTGLNTAKDRIVELCYIKVEPNGNEKSEVMRFNPECHIPEACTAVHGIKDEDVANCPTFKQKAAELAQTFRGCDFAGFNSNKMDVPMLVEEMLRAGIDFDISKHKLVDVQNIYHKLERRNLEAAYKFYCGKDLTDAHTALGDTKATYEVLMAQLDKYPDVLKNDVDFLSDYSRFGNNVDLAGRFVRNEKGQVEVNFGKYKGRLLDDVFSIDTSYHDWILKADFPQDTKNTVQRLYVEYKLKKAGK